MEKPTPVRFISLLLIAALASLPRAQAADIRHAQNFEITDHGTHRILSVSNAFRNTTRIDHYALVPKEREMPRLPKGLTVVRTPVERIVAMETVQIGYLEALGHLDSIIAAATVDFISHPDVRLGLADGTIQAVQTGQTLDIEKLLLLQPDLILSSISGDPAFDLPPKLERTGLPVVRSAGYMERHPLARAEWIKFMAAFFEEDERANQIFDAVEKRYQELTRLTEFTDEKPTVLCGAPYSGVWHVPGGDSYTAQTIRDAGGHYLWSEDASRGGIPLDTERVFLRAAKADYWINPSHYRSVSALLAADKRFGKFAAAKNGMVFNNTRQAAPGGGNAIWERGIIRPDDVLADMIHMFHPELLPEHEFVFYETLK